jgi:hypothetical protein
MSDEINSVFMNYYLPFMSLNNYKQRENIGEGGHSLVFKSRGAGCPLLPIPCWQLCFALAFI